MFDTRVTMSQTVPATALTIAATALVTGCAGSAGSPPSDAALAYARPSPPRAVYEIVDSMAVDIGALTGSITIEGWGSLTIGLTFEPDPDGVRVVGAVEAFAGALESSMAPTETAGLDDLNGDLEAVIGGRGLGEIASLPELDSPVAQISSFPVLAHLLFPPLPGGDPDPGATWADTVATSTETGEWSLSTTTVNTFTLVGDTTVGGRSLVHIAVSGHVEIENRIEQDGNLISQEVAGSSDGFLLWDPARRLVAVAEYHRNLEGTTSAGIFGAMGTAITGPTRLRLVYDDG